VHFGGEAMLKEDMRWECIYFMWGTYCYGGKAMRKDITRKSHMLTACSSNMLIMF
jgi:hypothetical protein